MILKWIFTFLAVMWIYRMFRQAFFQSPEPGNRHFQSPPPSSPGKPEGTVEIQRRKDDDDADFIDYEEV